MSTVQEVRKAFREARIAGEKLMQAGKITWKEFEFTMVSFELQLREMGEDL